MSEQADIVTVNGAQYDVSKMTDYQRGLVYHLRDLDNKIHRTETTLTQLRVGRESFVQSLVQDLQPSGPDKVP